jgi:hypothetical protein
MKLNEASGLTALALKGAITLTLGLSIFRNEDLDEEERTKAAFMASIISFLYILIDSVLIKYVMNWLKLANNTLTYENLLISVT